MIYFEHDSRRLEKINTDIPMWAFRYEETSITRASYNCQPVLGLLTYEYSLNEEIKTRSKTPEQRKKDGDRIAIFVPFKKRRNSDTIYDLAWSKAVAEYARDFSDTYGEAVAEYNKAVEKHIKLLEDRIEELKNLMV